jgi:hypothetical protein
MARINIVESEKSRTESSSHFVDIWHNPISTCHGHFVDKWHNPISACHNTEYTYRVQL